MDGICKPISGCTHPMFHWLRIFTRNGASRRPLISKRGNKDFYKGMYVVEFNRINYI